MEYAARQLARRIPEAVLGINIGKNKNTDDDVGDFVAVAEKLMPFADYLTINLSSPNTPGLRDLQTPVFLHELLTRLCALRTSLERACPILVKLSPDMREPDEVDLLSYLVQAPVDGLIISNTTIDKEQLQHLPAHLQNGGLSGPPLQQRSRDMLRRVHGVIKHQKPLIASGGINSGEEAYLRICSGASLCQIYTAFIYDGPSFISTALADMKRLLARDGFTNIQQAIGSKA